MEATRPSFPWINNYAILANCLPFPAVSPTSSAELPDAGRFAYQCRSWLPLFDARCFAGGASVAIKRAVDERFRRDDAPTTLQRLSISNDLQHTFRPLFPALPNFFFSISVYYGNVTVAVDFNPNAELRELKFR